jgi:alcohol dehydrogenase
MEYDERIPDGSKRPSGRHHPVRAEYMLVPHAQANLARIPDDLTDEDVVLCCDIMSTGFSAAERGRVKIGDSASTRGT